MSDKPAPNGMEHPIATHCWLEVPDLRSVDHKTPAHILLVGPEPENGPAISQALTEQGHRVTKAADWSQAMAKLESNPDFELIVCTQDAPDPAGLGLEHYLSEPHLLSSLPVIVACRGGDLGPVMGLLANGAVDFLSHPFNQQEMAVRVKKSLIQYRTMRLYLRAAHRDPLTGLYNKRVFNELLSREMSRARREGVPLGLLFMDLDHFKLVNDTYGHLAGDQTLQVFARRLCMWVREGDLVARYGGEEFVVLAPGAGEQGVSILGGRIREAMERPITTRAAEFTVTVSLGSAVYDGEKGLKPEEFLNRADEACYQAKAQGRNRLVLAD
ncbi:MAG: diguanylate cyclase [Desulfarculaceae bacterium]|nr:diguanylate cyclase [Desulfarculaceae bacterium]MCF8071384.1 diguanylate cyclase [Desulfarculaceae bacterium]MCF8101709.1 diguanylate cyclase [Desulfarculaceae bacterium]MCF8116682.1 diguanylate cyclase [Desulfarculaceae bacterium]